MMPAGPSYIMLGGAFRPLAKSPSEHSASAPEAATAAATEAATAAATEAATAAATAQLADPTPSAAVDAAHTHVFSLVEAETNVSSDAAGMVQFEAKDADHDAREASSKELDSKHGGLAAAHNINAPTDPVASLHGGKLNGNASCAQNSAGASDSVYTPATAFSGTRADCVQARSHGPGLLPRCTAC